MCLKTAPVPEPAASRPRSTGSIVIRLTAWYAGSSFLLILIATGVLYGTVAGNLRAQDRRILIDTAANLRLLLRRMPDAPTMQARIGRPLIWFRLIAPDGRVLVQTPGMDRLVPLAGLAAVRQGPQGGTVIGSVQTRGGIPFSILSELVPEGSHGRHADAPVLQVAIDQARDQSVLVRDRERLLFVLIVSLGLCAALGYAIARGGVRPVERITAAARGIKAATLHERLAIDDLPDELHALAENFNDMLDRLEASFARISQFSADVAHELRTPVNNLRGELEVALGRARTPVEYRDVLGSALEECGRINQIIQSLLFLARAEAEGGNLRRETLDLGAELGAIVEFYEPAALGAGIALERDGGNGLTGGFDRILLQQAIGNLIANGLAHTPRGGRVIVTARADDGAAVIEVGDTGCGIAPAHLPHVFDRFYRADPSRSSRGGNFGLGLSVVRSIATLHGGTVAITSAIGAGTVVTMRLPLRVG
jgi:two-component system heavy metal sensor histidine kinase CusS